jgi:transposase
VSLADGEIAWQKHDDDYKLASYMSHHGGIEQRWLLVYSEHAYLREKETLEKNPVKKEAELLECRF